jgi:hypothetical protein
MATGITINKKVSINLITIIIIVMVLIGLGIGGWKLYNYEINKYKSKNDSLIKLDNALNDSITYYKNSRNEIVAEKLTIQTTLVDFKKLNNRLDSSQRELLSRISELIKNKTLISAALVETQVKLDSIKNTMAVIDTTNKCISFTDSTKYYQYLIDVSSVMPVKKEKPSLTIEDLTLPNKSYITFDWGKRKEGYPISFSISNSNKYFHTVDIDSYAIPQLDKKVVDPTGWDKFKIFINGSGNTIIKVGVGVAIGGGLMWYLLK